MARNERINYYYVVDDGLKFVIYQNLERWLRKYAEFRTKSLRIAALARKVKNKAKYGVKGKVGI